jgi:hypothetical protein
VERTGSQYSCVMDFFNDCYELLVAIALQFLIILITVNSKRLLPCSQLVWAVSMIHQLSAWIIHMCNVKKKQWSQLVRAGIMALQLSVQKIHIMFKLMIFTQVLALVSSTCQPL